MIGRRVEYQTGHGEFNTGTVIKFYGITNVVVVKDDEDGSLWRGWEDQITFLDEKTPEPA